MRNTEEASGLPQEHRGEEAEQANMPGRQDKGAQTDSRAGPSHDSEQAARDKEEKSKHPVSENALGSSQDKNPVPPGSTAE
jgi:hypothetical protein